MRGNWKSPAKTETGKPEPCDKSVGKWKPMKKREVSADELKSYPTYRGVSPLFYELFGQKAPKKKRKKAQII